MLNLKIYRVKRECVIHEQIKIITNFIQRQRRHSPCIKWLYKYVIINPSVSAISAKWRTHTNIF